MIAELRSYLMAGLIIVLLTTIGISRWELYSISKEYSEYKANINEQVEKAKNEKIRIEAEQDAKAKQANEAYQRDLDRLNDALDRMRSTRTVSRETTLRVDGVSTSSMPKTSTDSTGTIEGVEIEARVRQSAFYREALKDTLQCSRLIEFVKP